MGPILCAADDTEGARAAIRVTRELAEKLGARVVLVNVEPSPSVPGVSSALAGHARLRTEEIDDGQKLLSWLAAEEGLEDAELRVAIGSAADRIVGVARETEASMVVIGSRGRGDLTSAVLGSVSARVASTAPCPVVVVPPGASTRA